MLCHRRFSHHKKQTRRQAAEKGHPEALCLPDVPSLLFLYCFFTALFFAASFASADEFCCEHCHRREHQSHVRCDRCIVTGLYRRGLLRLRLGLCLSLCIGDGHMRFCICLTQCHGGLVYLNGILESCRACYRLAVCIYLSDVQGLRSARAIATNTSASASEPPARSSATMFSDTSPES